MTHTKNGVDLSKAGDRRTNLWIQVVTETKARCESFIDNRSDDLLKQEGFQNGLLKQARGQRMSRKWYIKVIASAQSVLHYLVS